MREIKFRAWDNLSSKWLENFFIEPDGTIVFKTTGSLGDFAREVLIMQYTGLKDRLGKEIYEGDIIYREICAKDDSAYGEYTIIRWDINCFNIPRISWLYEVIGNIYENPEFLGECNV